MITRALLAAVAAALVWSLALSCCPASVFPDPARSIRNDLHLTGVVTELDPGIQEFVLRDRGKSYVVLADYATVQLNGGKFGDLRDLRDGATVRVFGERLSSRTVLASVVIVLEGSGKLGSASLIAGGYRTGEEIEVIGTVTHVSVRANDISFRAESGNYVITPTLATIITRCGRRVGVGDVYVGDTIFVTGILTGPAKISAGGVQVIDPRSGFRAPGGGLGRRYRLDCIGGVVVGATAGLDRKLSILTEFGVRTVDLTAGPDIRRGAERIALKDLAAGNKVRVHGSWETRTLHATTIELAPPEPKKTSDHLESAKQKAGDSQRVPKE